MGYIDEKEITGIRLLKQKKFFHSLEAIEIKIADTIRELSPFVIPADKWSKIYTKSGKFMWYNKEIDACYPRNIKSDYRIDSGRPVSEALDMIKKDSEYQSYGIKWNIQNYNESYNSFYDKWHPFETDSTYHHVAGANFLSYRDGDITKAYNNDPNRLGKQISGRLIPIFRIGGKNIVEKIFKLLENNLILEGIKNSDELSKKYFFIEKCRKYINEIDENINITWNIELICEDIVRNGIGGDIFREATFELSFDNGEKEIVTYINGVKSGLSKYIYTNGDVEKRTYVDGILQGEARCRHEDGSVENRTYVDGVLHGEAFLYRDYKLEKAFEYERGRKRDTTDCFTCLNFDKIRVNLDKYDENILLDPNRGHWELFDNEELREKIQKDIGKKVYGRDPKVDIKDGGIVGIDFGTKSTVVVFQNDNKILPMRISGRRLAGRVEPADYENPTVIEFIDLESFVKDYSEKEGRPLTKWEDVTVSHTAFSHLVNGTNDEFYSAISDLKQWAASKNEKIVICDKKNHEHVFDSYLTFEDGDIDPIEFYAYYIGSYINNMRNGIYMEYFLSFPVTYEKEIRKRILTSFERGIKKSLPVSLLNDKEAMEEFSVQHGANEPAAYAVCALQEYQFEPDEDEKIHYGVFDFGGGTADFDFGIWRGAEDIRSFDFELEHFGAGGDRYLGGENILRELAYEVFKANADILRNRGISFARPEWCEQFAGDELLVDSSREAKLNVRQMMEKLRPVWEGPEAEVREVIKMPLYTRDGVQENGIELHVDIEHLKDIIREKIANGVKNFFVAMENAFADEEYEEVIILLAGNSCKHPAVKEIFAKHIEENSIPAKLYPALGTEEAFEILREKGVEIPEDEVVLATEKPTGKTGVAYGLLESRTGGRIKIINRDEEGNAGKEINFKYYVGYEGRKKLRVVLSPETKYNSPQYLLNVTAKVFDLYYTTLPEASNDKLPIDKVKRKRVKLNEKYEDAKIYIESIGAETLKYIISQKDITEKEYLEEGEIELN